MIKIQYWLILLFTIVLTITFQVSGQNNLSHNHYKYRVSSQVYNNIIFAFGDGRSPPSFEINPGSSKRKVIMMYYPGDNPRIVMDEGVYDICAGLGADSLSALAVLIGHELAHHYEKHDWCSTFAFLLGEDDALGRQIKQIGKEQRLKFEAEADYYGGFYGYIAGYATYDIMPELLDKIYDHYNLPEQVKGYPTKTERGNIAVKSLKKLDDWIAVFDAAEFLFALKEYEASSTCFAYLTEKFPSREMFNNAGVTRALAAMDYVDESIIPFALPLELDAKTRLKSGKVRGNDISKDEREDIKNNLLNEALKYFEQAIDKDPTYLNAKINKGCVLLLLQRYHGVIDIADQLINDKKVSVGNYDLSKAYTLRAIAYHYEKKANIAQAGLEKAKKLATTARTCYNLQLLNDMNNDIWNKFWDYIEKHYDEPKKESQFGDEKASHPDNEKIGLFAASEVSLLNNAVTVSSTQEFTIKYTKHDSYDAIVVANREETFKFLHTKPGYPSKTNRGIGCFDSSNLVKKQYGIPTYAIDVLQGQYMVYRKSRIIFLISHSGLVQKWYIYNRG